MWAAQREGFVAGRRAVRRRRWPRPHARLLDLLDRDQRWLGRRAAQLRPDRAELWTARRLRSRRLLNDTPASASNEGRHSFPRSPWAAALFSLVAPGLGQLYAGYARRAVIALLLVLTAELLAVPLAMMFVGSIQLYALALIVIFCNIVIPWDAYRRARAANSQFIPRGYNRWYVYTSLILVCMFLVSPSIRRYTLANFMRAYRLPSASMRPGLLEGDFLLARISHAPFHAGQIVAYRTPQTVILKRIVGTPGDTLSMKRGTLYVNGREVVEPYSFTGDTTTVSTEDFDWQRAFLLSQVDSSSYHPTANTWGPLLVPDRRYFVLGDNRSQSEDSRHDGFIDERAIVAEATTVYFSRDYSAKKVRWNRIGLAIR